MRYDFNVLERRAKECLADDRPADAVKIYLFMADGDPSLDAGYLGERIAQCYERMGDLHAAKVLVWASYRREPSRTNRQSGSAQEIRACHN